MLRGFQLEQIEADVVIVLINKTDGITGQIIPLWECDLNDDELLKMGAQEALSFSEECAGGVTTFLIHDYRKQEGGDNA